MTLIECSLATVGGMALAYVTLSLAGSPVHPVFLFIGSLAGSIVGYSIFRRSP